MIEHLGERLYQTMQTISTEMCAMSFPFLCNKTHRLTSVNILHVHVCAFESERTSE